MRTGSLYWKQGVGEYKNKIIIITIIIKTGKDRRGAEMGDDERERSG